MNAEYEIDPTSNLIRVRWNGAFTIDDMIRHSLRVNGDSKFVPGMNTLVDFREGEFEDNVEELRRYVELTLKLEKVRGPCKWACLADDTFFRDLVWTFDLVLKGRGGAIRSRAFRDEAEALAWLDEDEE